MNLLKQYKNELLNSIPVVSGMEIDIKEVQKLQITLSAPLSTNINYEGTAFGGSINTLCILASYLLTHHRVKQEKLNLASLVIQDSFVKYLLPVNTDFTAKASITELAALNFVNTLKRKGIGRLSVDAVIEDQSKKELVKFKGRFVARLKNE